MNKTSLSIGSTVYYQNIGYTITKQISFQKVMGKRIDQPHDLCILPIKYLTNQAPETESNETDVSLVDPKLWNEALRRFNIIKPLLEYRTLEIVKNVAKENNISVATIYLWLKSYEQTGTAHALIPKFKARGGKDASRLPQEVELILNTILQDRYLNQQKYPIRTIYREIVQECKNVGLRPPHINTVQNRINNLDIKSVVKKREGNSIRETRGMPDKFPFGKYPLELIEIDHTKLDIILVDEKERKEIGRPYLTLAIDVFSRMVAGFYISLEAPSFFNTGQCLLNAILMKDDLLHKLNIQGEWPLYGLPKSIHMDNAKEFRGIDLQRFCEQYGVEIKWRPVARPEYGGHIERLLGTASKEIHTLPGATFSNIQKRGKYNSQANAAMTITEIEKWLVEYFVNVYHQRVHRSLGMTPLEKYTTGIFGLNGQMSIGLPPIINDSLMLRASLLPSFERAIRPNGITIDHITYYSDVLREWIIPKSAKLKKEPQQFLCRRDPRDLSKIYFYDPKIETYFEVPYRNINNPSINLVELRQAIARLKKEQGGTIIEEHDIFLAYNKLKMIETNAVNATKLARRQESSKKHLAKKLATMPKAPKNKQSLEQNGQKHAVESTPSIPWEDKFVDDNLTPSTNEFFDIDFYDGDN